MRHYQLIPVRYNDQQLLVRCEPIDAELWSIQWLILGTPIDPVNEFGIRGAQPIIDPRLRWFADCAPTEYENAQAIVKWLNNVEAMKATLPPGIYAVESRSK